MSPLVRLNLRLLRIGNGTVFAGVWSSREGLNFHGGGHRPMETMSVLAFCPIHVRDMRHTMFILDPVSAGGANRLLLSREAGSRVARAPGGSLEPNVWCEG